MNLTKLFEMQIALDERIEKENPVTPGEDRLAKKILALQVELGELANEWRGFKFWSKDQSPKVVHKGACDVCSGIGYLPGGKDCTGGCSYGLKRADTVLEEYVDCLHFLLSIGLESDVHLVYEHEILKMRTRKEENLIDQFLETKERCFMQHPYTSAGDWFTATKYFLGLGEMLEFTWEQIEAAYLEKNQVNHIRQATGY